MHTSFAKPIYPRPNDLNSGFFLDDINKIIDPVTVKAIDGIMVPKVNTAEEMEEINHILKGKEKEVGVEENYIQVLAQIESCEAVNNLNSILEKGKGRIKAAVFGGDDFLTDFGVTR